MKKILVFLGIINISSGAIPNVTAAIPYHNLEDGRGKATEQVIEDKFKDNKIVYSYNFLTERTTLYATFNPFLWKKIMSDYIRCRNKLNFITMFIKKINNYAKIATGIDTRFYLSRLGEAIYNNLSIINSIWTNSNQSLPIKITVSVAKIVRVGWTLQRKIIYETTYDSAMIQSDD